MNPAQRPSGFTLIELAIVLFIVALLMGGLMLPLSAQMEARGRAETDKALGEIREALIGYALTNKKLPCPMLLAAPGTAGADPANATYGVAAATCSPGVEGYLPWKTLGVREIDGWGTPRAASTDPFVGYWKYRLDRNFGVTFTLSTALGGTLTVNDHQGNALTDAAGAPVALVYSTGANKLANGRNGDGTVDDYEAGENTASFDDQVLWISRPLLIGRMVSAGAL